MRVPSSRYRPNGPTRAAESSSTHARDPRASPCIRSAVSSSHGSREPHMHARTVHACPCRPGDPGTLPAHHPDAPAACGGLRATTPCIRLRAMLRGASVAFFMGALSEHARKPLFRRTTAASAGRVRMPPSRRRSRSAAPGRAHKERRRAAAAPEMNWERRCFGT